MYSFGDIYGNELIVSYLKRAARIKKPSHAYIISGAQGSGKKLIARTFAKALQCEETFGAPCGKCISCRTFDSMNHPDIIYVTSANVKTIGVDDVREQVLDKLSERPFKYRFKIFIIEKGDTLTPAAQNALLKALEEPALYGVFLITAANEGKFLPTVLSRTVVLKTKPLPAASVYNYLTEKAGVPEAAANEAGTYSEGSIGKALNLLNDEGFAQLKQAAEDIVKNTRETYAGMFEAAKELEPFKPRMAELLNILYLMYRDIIVYKATKSEKHILWKQNISRTAETAEKSGMDVLLKRLNAITYAMDIISKNANFTISADVLMMDLNALPEED
jgi:DNA polymerase-3 subunit delta'